MDTSRCLAVVAGMAVAMVVVSQPVPAVGAQASRTPGSRREAPAPNVYTPARTPWGDPDISGVYTNNDESLIPFERPAQFEGRRLEDITPAELEALRDARSDQREEADRNRALDAGFDEHIVKPAELAKLREMIARCSQEAQRAGGTGS